MFAVINFSGYLFLRIVGKIPKIRTRKNFMHHGNIKDVWLVTPNKEIWLLTTRKKDNEDNYSLYFINLFLM